MSTVTASDPVKRYLGALRGFTRTEDHRTVAECGGKPVSPLFGMCYLGSIMVELGEPSRPAPPRRIVTIQVLDRLDERLLPGVDVEVRVDASRRTIRTDAQGRVQLEVDRNACVTLVNVVGQQVVDLR